MKTKLTSALFFGLAFIASLVVAPVTAKDSNEPAARKSKTFQQVLKTEAVRILSLELAPGEYLDFHATPQEEVYAATNGTLRMVDADGKTQDLVVKSGDRLWNTAGQVKNWNTGNKNFKVVILAKEATSL